MQFKYKIELVGMNDCVQFVNAIVTSGKVATISDGQNYRVSAKSLLGALTSLEWDNTVVESDDDIYMDIQKWIKD